jgi:hypothetical protein
MGGNFIDFLPESSGGMKCSAESPSSHLWCQIGRQGWDGFGVVTRIICKLDSYGLSGALWDSAIQLLNSSLGLYSLIETDETNTFGEPLKRTKRKCGNNE